RQSGVAGLREGWRAGWYLARQGPLGGRRVWTAAAVLVLGPFFLSTFTAWKVAMPSLRPFECDALLSQLDFMLHGGAPHRLVAWIPVSAMDRIYSTGWIFMFGASVLTIAWKGDTRAMLAIVLTWIVLGTIIAYLVPSAGPIFYARIVGDPNPYVGLMESLEASAPLAVLATRDYLWGAYGSGSVALGSGISAFPSMHVAFPTVLTWAAFRHERRIGKLMAGWTVLVLMGSVALGWHYAI